MSFSLTANRQSNGLYQIKPEDFDRFTTTKYLTSEQRQNILAQKVAVKTVEKLATLINKPSGMPDLLYRYSFPENLVMIPMAALRARFDEKITDEQLTTLCLLYEFADQLILNPKYIQTYTITKEHQSESVTTVFPIKRFIPRLDTPPKNNPLPVIPEHLRQYQDKDEDAVMHPFTNFIQTDHAFSSSDQTNADRLLQTFFGYSDEEFIEFKNRLKSALPSEHFFYAFPIPPGDVAKWAPMYARICEVLGQRHPVTVAKGPITKTEHQHFEPRRVRIVPSFSMLRIFLEVRYKEHASMQVSLLGKISTKTIGLLRESHQTVFNIGIPGAELPHEADNIKTGGQGVFTDHDDYHAQRYSMIRNNEKDALVYVVNKVLDNALKIQPTDPNNPAIRKIKWRLTDAELHDSVIRGHKFGAIFPKLSLWNEDSKKLVITDMIFRKAVWRDLGLSRTDLYAEEQRVYDEIQVSYDKISKIREFQFIDPITPEQYEEIKKFSGSRRIVTF